MVNKAACKLLGYSKKELLTKNRSAIFDITEGNYKQMLMERMADGHSMAFVTAINKSGKLLPCEITSSIFMDGDGIEESVTTIADRSQSVLKQKEIDIKKEKIVSDNIVLAISKQKKIDTKNKKIVADNIDLVKSNQKNIDSKKEKIVADNIMLAQAKSDARLAENDEEHSEIFLLTSKISFDGIWDWNLLTDEFFLGAGFKELFGYTIHDTGDISNGWRNYLHPDDKESVEKGLQDAIASSVTYWERACRFLRSDGSVAKVFGRANIIRHANGKAWRMIGAIHDLGRQKELEEKLEQEIKLKAKQIAQATEDGKDIERSDIGKELHDNVNQLLSASRMYLEVAKRQDGDNRMYISRSSEYILTAIEEIRKLTKGMTTDIIKNLGLCDAICNVTKDTMEVSPVKILCALESFKEDSVQDKFKLNVFRIVQEHLNNILKYARTIKVSITLSQTEKSIVLVISDNGIGFDTGKRLYGMGLANIKSRAVSFNGSADFISQHGRGCVLTVTFPVTNQLLNKAGGEQISII